MRRRSKIPPVSTPCRTGQGRTVGVIGLGVGRAHIAAFQAHGCRVTAVCQRDAAKARTIADRYGVPRVFDRWEEMLEQARPEIVVIATPPNLHHPIALRALSAGAHVLCEKPLAMNGVEARAMMEAANRAGRVAMTCFNWRSPAAMQHFHAMVRRKFLGRLFHASARSLVSRWADEAPLGTWRMDRAQAGHGVLGDLGVHLIDMVRWNFGEFARVCATTAIAYRSRKIAGGGRPADTEDVGAMIGELTSGAVVSVTVSRAARATNEQTLEAFGSHGVLAYRLPLDPSRGYRGELRGASGSGPSEALRVPPGPLPSGQGAPIDVLGTATIGPLVVRFLAGIRKGQSPSPSFEDGGRAQAVLDAARESASRRKWVDVEPV